MKPERIPLFPLDVVLFPTVELPLHIFEPRYKEMIGRCLDEHLEFGVVLARQKGVARVGCTAKITDVVKRYPDGRLDILATGETPFRILEVIEERSYYEARVEYLSDPPGSEVSKHGRTLMPLFEKCHRILYGKPPEDTDPQQEYLAFYVASELPVDLDFKQVMLELRDESERQLQLIARLEELVPHLARVEHTKRRAGGNGHGLAEPS